MERAIAAQLAAQDGAAARLRRGSGRLRHGKGRMKFWQVLAYERTENLVPLAQTCEELGFEGVFLSDHVVGHADIQSKYPYSYNDGQSDFVAQTEFPEPFAAISAMAAVTSKLRFNTQIYIAPLRHPIHLAKSVATASALSAYWQRGESSNQ